MHLTVQNHDAIRPDVVQKIKFSIKDCDQVRNCDQILNGKLHFLCSVIHSNTRVLKRPRRIAIKHLFKRQVRETYSFGDSGALTL